MTRYLGWLTAGLLFAFVLVLLFGGMLDPKYQRAEPVTAPVPAVDPVPAPVIIEVPVPVVTERVVTETRYLVEEVEVPVETIVEVPVTDQAALDASYVTGYTDGRVEGEDWVGSLWQHAVTTPCPTEDSENCIWIATERGNGLGSSFVNIEGELFFLPITEGVAP